MVTMGSQQNHRSPIPLWTALMLLAVLLVPSASFAQDSEFSAALEVGVGKAALVSFVAGFLTSLTPCVYPMIAITVSVFGAKQAKSRAEAMMLSTAFVMGMVVLFTAMFVIVSLTGGVFGSILQNKWVIVGIAVVFIAMAASMFGAFELTLPDSMMQRLSGMGGVGYGGAFTLGLVSGLVAAPCSGPVLISMMAAVASKQSAALGITFGLSYAVGLGMLFWFVGTFAAALPKGGKWMVWVKSFFGIVMLVLAFYYLKNAFPVLADSAKHETAFLAIAGGIAVFGLALGAVHKNWDEGAVARVRKGVGILAAVTGSFLFLAAIEKPKAASAEDIKAEQDKLAAKGEKIWPALEFGHDEEKGVAAATNEKRPMIVDFGADWCGACKELEKHTFSDAKVKANAGRFVGVKVDATNEEDPKVVALTKKYNVKGLPTVVILDSQGKEVKRFTEFVDAEKFLAALEPVQ
jgi:thiol:disulfide interchange protein DsbD